MTSVTKHTINGKVYEIRTTQTDIDLEIATFFDGKRVGRYSISLEDAEHVQKSQWQPAIKELIDIAKGDLESGIVKVVP